MPRPRRRPAGSPEPASSVEPSGASASLALGVLMVLLAAWSWRKWPDVFVDFGHELYIPWQLSEGRVLYRDITYFMGPLSQYLNALAFSAFGVSFTTLIFVNLTILAGITLGLYHVFARALSPWAGLLSGAVFLCVFAFAQYVPLGNYNYVTPYLHEQTHGVALGVLLVLLIGRSATRPSLPLTAAAAVTLGLTFLTKAEAFVPALASAAMGSALITAVRRPTRGAVLRHALAFGAASFAPVAVAVALLSTAMPMTDAIRGVAGNWPFLVHSQLVTSDPYYANNLGLAEIGPSLLEIARQGTLWALFGLATFALERGFGARGRGGAVAAAVLVAAFLVTTTSSMTWLDLAPPLPFACGALAAWFTWRTWKNRDNGSASRDLLLAVWAVFSMVSLAKMALNARLGHYGFALAMPGTVLLAAWGVFVVPTELQRRRLSGGVWRAAALSVVIVATGSLLGLSHRYYEAKTYPVGEGGDRFWSFDPRLDPRSEYFVAAMQSLETSMPPEATLAVFPDGVLLNYLLRRPNPTPYYLLTPWELRAFGGEDEIFEQILPAAPDFVVLAKLDMSEYGPRFFGFDPQYGERMRLWLEQNYDGMDGIGYEPITGRPWLRIFRRRDGHVVTRELPATGEGS